MRDDSDILLMFSGGLDSTGVFYKLIKEKRKLHVHHLYLVNKENRQKAEDVAVKSVCEYMKNLGNFYYSESIHEYPCYNDSFMWDSDLYNFIAGTICLSLKTIKEVAIGRTKTDSSRRVDERAKRGTTIFESFGTNAKKVYPLIDLTKKEIYESMPEDLRNLTWSCRTPIYYVNGDIKECGKCKACKELRFI
jgi:7-cyano-7-deazaguanine synthase in queuosine biosynthesis